MADLHFKLAYNTILQLFGRIVTAVSAALVTLMVARGFGVSGYGFYTVVFSYIALFYVFTDFGINSIFVKETSAEPEKQKELFPNLLGLRLTLSLVVVFVAITVLAFTTHPSSVKLGIIIGLVMLVTQGLSTTALALFQTRINYFRSVVTDILGSVALVILVYLASNFHNLTFIVIAVTLGSVFKVIVGFYLVRYDLGFLKVSFNRKAMGQLFIAAVPIGLIAIFSQFNAQIDKQIVLLAHYSSSLKTNSEVAIGIYGLAYKIFEFGIVLPTFVLNVAYPIMIQRKKESLDSLLNYSRFIGKLLIIFGFISLIIGWVLVPSIVSILGGEKFSAAILTTRILFLGFPLFFITPLTLWLAISLEKLKEVVFIYGFAAALNFVANLALVPKFGYNAAAVITLISELTIFSLTLAILLIDKNIPFGIKNDLTSGLKTQAASLDKTDDVFSFENKNE